MRLLLAAIVGLVLLLGVQTWRVSSWKGKHETLSAQYQKEKAEAKAAYDKADQDYRATEERHKLELKGIVNETQAQIDKAQLDASNARRSSKRLLDAFANTPGCSQTPGSTTTATASQAASAPEDLRRNVFSRIDDAAGELAKYADEAHIAGLACERAYEVVRKSY
jgi:multidrug resistance efflux pump